MFLHYERTNFTFLCRSIVLISVLWPKSPYLSQLALPVIRYFLLQAEIFFIVSKAPCQKGRPWFSTKKDGELSVFFQPYFPCISYASNTVFPSFMVFKTFMFLISSRSVFKGSLSIIMRFSLFPSLKLPLEFSSKY